MNPRARDPDLGAPAAAATPPDAPPEFAEKFLPASRPSAGAGTAAPCADPAPPAEVAEPLVAVSALPALPALSALSALPALHPASATSSSSPAVAAARVRDPDDERLGAERIVGSWVAGCAGSGSAAGAC